jgi:dUTP pyrophosphatase
MKHVFNTIRVDKGLPLPYQKRETDAGYDLYAAESKWIWPLQTKRINSNHKIEISDNIVGLIQPRSNIRSQGLFVDGVIDCGYQGIWGIIVTNISWFPKKVRKGDRICQVLYLEPHKVLHGEVKEFTTKTDRGEQGFGSSGNK